MRIVSIDAREAAKAKLLEFIRQSEETFKKETNKSLDSGFDNEKSRFGFIKEILQFPKLIKDFKRELLVEGLAKVIETFPHSVPDRGNEKIEAQLQKSFDSLDYTLVECFTDEAKRAANINAFYELKDAMHIISDQAKLPKYLKSVFDDVREFLDKQIDDLPKETSKLQEGHDYRMLQHASL